jgi:uncharacterized integral membrane protein (TIGR00698 family)
LIGGAVIAILIGIVLGNVWRMTAIMKPGITFCSKKVLQASIIALGGGLSLRQVWHTGRESLAVMLMTLGMALLAAFIIGKLLRVHPKLASLVGVGTGICGGSAIAAIAPIIQADDADIAFAISTVFLFNIVAVLVFPLIGHLLRLSDTGFGIWAGTAINDTSSVVAAGYAYSQHAGEYATITKMARTTMIVPISLVFAFVMTRQAKGAGKYQVARVFPWFILAFLAAAILNTIGVLGPMMSSWCTMAGKFFIIVALAGVGLGTDLRAMLKTGPRPIVLGLLVWALVALTSLGIQDLARQW